METNDENDLNIKDKYGPVRAEMYRRSKFKASFSLGNKHKKDSIYQISYHLIEKYYIKTIKGKGREMLIYQDGVYIPGEEIIRKEIRQELQELCTNTSNKEIIETIKDLTPIDRDKFVVDKNLLNLNNGVLNVRTRELEEHNPNYLFITKIPVNFEPQADCPTIKKFLSDVLDEDQELVIQEWSGYALYPEYFIKKAIVFVGEGDTGKTTLINLYNSFFGEPNVSVISLQKISTDKFAGSNLYKKYMNIYDDLSFKDINDNGAFKIATGGGVVTGEKKFGDLFQFKNFAKLTFACNKFPNIDDTDDKAYFMRWIVIKFNYPIEDKDKDKQLIHKMTTPEELSGFLNLALIGLTRLLKNEKFTYDKSVEEIKAEMLRSGSSIASFADDCLEECTDGFIKKVDMHRAYVHYARLSKLPIASMKKFGGRLSKYATYTSDGRPMDPKTGDQITGTAWMNIKFKNSFIPPLPEKTDEPEQQELINDTS